MPVHRFCKDPTTALQRNLQSSTAVSGRYESSPDEIDQIRRLAGGAEGDADEVPVLADRAPGAPLDEVADDRQRGAIQLLPDDEALFPRERLAMPEHREHQTVRVMIDTELRRVAAHAATYACTVPVVPLPLAFALSP